MFENLAIGTWFFLIDMSSINLVKLCNGCVEFKNLFSGCKKQNQFRYLLPLESKHF